MNRGANQWIRRWRGGTRIELVARPGFRHKLPKQFPRDLSVSAVRYERLEPKLRLTENTPSARLKWHGKTSSWHPLWRTQRRA